MKRKALVMLAVSIMTAAVMAGCGGSDKNGSSNESGKEKYIKNSYCTHQSYYPGLFFCIILK